MLPPIPLVLVLLTLGVFLWRPNAVLLFAVFMVLTGFFGFRAVEGLAHSASGVVDGWVTLLDDPQLLSPNGTRVTVRHRGKRFEAQAYGMTAARLSEVLAGESVHISGVAKATNNAWHRWRHIVGKISVKTVNNTAEAAPMLAFTNSVRRLLARGAQSLSEDDRALFTGMVYGDNRQQSARLADDFQAAGLGHLLVVSGQNVAFVLALMSPFTCSLRPGTRLVVLLCVLGVFATITRFEPSVLRAVAMAAVAITSTALGYPKMGRHVLAWAIAVVLVIDPFVLRLLAFQLSVCATAGLLWITPLLMDTFRGPRALRLAVAATVGAQIGVMPILVAVFGGVPLASFVANIIAGSVSGPIMMWGLTAGFVAGLTGGWMAWLVHQPTAMLLWWVRFVAANAASMPPAMLGTFGVVIFITGLLFVLVAHKIPLAKNSQLLDGLVARAGRRMSDCGAVAVMRSCGIVAVFSICVVRVAGAASPPLGWSSVQGAAVFSHKAGIVVVLDQPARPREILESLRLAGVRWVNLIVATDGDAAEAYAVLALNERYQRTVVVAPPMHRIPRARTVVSGSNINLSSTLKAVVVSHDPKLEIAVRSRLS